MIKPILFTLIRFLLLVVLSFQGTTLFLFSPTLPDCNSHLSSSLLLKALWFLKGSQADAYYQFIIFDGYGNTGMLIKIRNFRKKVFLTWIRLK